jgi:hypothetical protein
VEIEPRMMFEDISDGLAVGLCKLTHELESAWFQPLSL